jgi:nicotinate-nucleotide adenylyltransferase
LIPATAVFGGTFDPIHFGHLRSAMELLDALKLGQLRFMPAADPPHRDAPSVCGEHRAAMLELAIEGEQRFVCDRRELMREGPSYSVLSLEELRTELGPDTPLYMVLGADALASLPTWHRWRELLGLAHLVAIARPGWPWPHEGEIAELLSQRAAEPEDIAAVASGQICIQTLRPQAVSATAIRSLLQSRRSARYLLPDSVLDYIARHELYTGAAPDPQE